MAKPTTEELDVAQFGRVLHERPAMTTTPEQEARGEFVLVPREPTQAMIDAALDFHENGLWTADDKVFFGGHYKAMLAAAPSPTGESEAGRLAKAHEIAMALCLVDGRDPDAEAPLSEMTDDANMPVPWWMVYVEYAEALLDKFDVRSLRAQPPQPTGDVALRQREHVIQSLIAGFPDPLKKLGEDLASWLDEDRWPSAEDNLLAIGSLLDQANSRLAESVWRDISTAPKDGTVVLICGFGTNGYFVADAKWDGEWLIFVPDDDAYGAPCFNPKFWMPLPLPPALSTVAGEEK